MDTKLRNIDALQTILSCPCCGAIATDGLDVKTNQCRRCNAVFFSLGLVPCWFTNGLGEKKVWEATLANMMEQWNSTLEGQRADVSRKDLMPTVCARLDAMIAANQTTIALFDQLTAEAGLRLDKADPRLAVDPSTYTGYFELLLRDWHTPNESKADENHENNHALDRILSAINDAEASAKQVLTMGAGAGRLSWDLHCALKPELSVALDYNPILLMFAQQLVLEQNPLQLANIRPYPQAQQNSVHLCDLAPADAREGDISRWFALGADAWEAPLQDNSFDLIITPWFIDVCGRDVRDLIALVDRLLKPGGLWLNSGPLLYLDKVPYPMRYTHEEIKEFLALAQYEVCHDSVELDSYLDSPFDRRGRYEEIWTFAARKPAKTTLTSTDNSEKDSTPAWLVLTHLPIPVIPINTALPDHPALNIIKENINGERSIRDLALMIQKKLQPALRTASPTPDFMALTVDLLIKFIIR